VLVSFPDAAVGIGSVVGHLSIVATVLGFVVAEEEPRTMASCNKEMGRAPSDSLNMK
jgi:hypothetical protein